MTNPSEQLPATSSLRNEEKEIIILADVCFEMFPIKELRRPRLILDELRAAFPDFDEGEILKAISLALTWRRLLRTAGKQLH